MKRVLMRFANGFSFSIAITLLIQLVVMATTGESPLLSEFAALFRDVVTAFSVQLLLVGVMSGVTSAGTVVFESRRMGLLVQSLVYLIVMLSAWIPVAVICWGFGKYPQSMVVTTLSLVASYAICWGIQYRLCRRDIEEINLHLSRKKGA